MKATSNDALVPITHDTLGEVNGGFGWGRAYAMAAALTGWAPPPAYYYPYPVYAYGFRRRR